MPISSLLVEQIIIINTVAALIKTNINRFCNEGTRANIKLKRLYSLVSTNLWTLVQSATALAQSNM